MCITDFGKIKIKRPEDALGIFRNAALLGDEQENFFVLPLDTKSHPLCTTPLRVVRGTLDRAPIHAREVFKAAIRWGAHSVIIAHNHPSGDPTPSVDDIRLTRQLVEASRIVGIPIVDHLILVQNAGRPHSGYVSIRRNGEVSF